MKFNYGMAALLLLPLAVAGRRQSPVPRHPVGHPGLLGEYGKIFLSDFTTPEEQRGFNLLKAGKQGEARALFAAALPTDTTGVAAVGLAQATSPDEWPAQIKDLDAKLGRKQDDTRLTYRLGLLLYYDGVSQATQGRVADMTEFDRATDLLYDLWKHTHDPLAGLTLTEMAFRFHTKDCPNNEAILESLIGVVGGKEARAAYARAKQAGFAGSPPDVSVVTADKRHPLAGVLVGLWTVATARYATMAAVDKAGKPIPANKQVMVEAPVTAVRVREAAYLDKWIQSLHPELGKKQSVAGGNH